ncbi:hypothetical protein [Oceanithermus desulfurans]|uniref:Competence protein n=2 Tax=Oceanithermus desulfurans TaxID=227924 RepID=A0A511RIL9_9DEIN|nr:hypothetical protein [Oceanithermus desulfurans]MBB6028888.1 hypothetical protein [Oceanithermus desulfurans]GEM88947.1 competence protein [Oceanithermus desulfurans NBRC 100063]
MKMSQSTRILILLALLVAAVAVWYSLFFSPTAAPQAGQPAPQPEAKAPAQPAAAPPVTTSARALQVLPIPFLVTEAPEEVPLETGKAQQKAVLASASVPPNPFVPLRPPKAPAAARPQEVPENQQPVTIAPEPELPANIPLPKVVTPEGGTVTPPPVALGQGTLPVKLTPLAQEVEPQTPLEAAQPEPAAPEQPEETPPPAEPPPPPPNPLIEWANQYGLQLDGVALGPVSVAIFKTVGGYLALPVGQTFPDKNVLVKTITAERVLLVDDSGTHTLTLELGGGE